jgi:hypothetical protein
LLLLLQSDNRCSGEPSMEDFQQLLTTHTRQQIRLTESIWLSEFKINERQVRVSARVLLQTSRLLAKQLSGTLKPHMSVHLLHLNLTCNDMSQHIVGACTV